MRIKYKLPVNKRAEDYAVTILLLKKEGDEWKEVKRTTKPPSATWKEIVFSTKNTDIRRGNRFRVTFYIRVPKYYPPINNLQYQIIQKDPLIDPAFKQLTNKYDMKPIVKFSEQIDQENDKKPLYMKKDYRQIYIAIHSSSQNTAYFENKNGIVPYKGSFDYYWPLPGNKFSFARYAVKSNKEFHLAKMCILAPPKKSTDPVTPKIAGINYLGYVGDFNAKREKLISILHLTSRKGKMNIYVKQGQKGIQVTATSPFKGIKGKWKFKLSSKKTPDKPYYSTQFLDGSGSQKKNITLPTTISKISMIWSFM